MWQSRVLYAMLQADDENFAIACITARGDGRVIKVDDQTLRTKVHATGTVVPTEIAAALVNGTDPANIHSQCSMDVPCVVTWGLQATMLDPCVGS